MKNLDQINSNLNNNYPKLLQAVSSKMPEKKKLAIVHRFIEDLNDLKEALENDK
tara:strand:+ start:597 stop:758 length:162 start_codon:yes stop_codon:yes gene_type:complete